MQNPSASQVHWVSESYLGENREAILEKYKTSLIKFVKIQDFESTLTTTDIFSATPLLALMDRIGAIEIFATDDPAVKEAYQFFVELTGFDLSIEDFLLLIQGDKTMTGRFAVPPVLHAVDIALALRAEKTRLEQAKQSA